MNAEDNPYSASGYIDSEPLTAGSTESVTVPEFSNDTRGNVKLVSTLVKIGAISAFIMCFACIIQIWATTKFYGWPEAWKSYKSIILIRCFFAPCWLILALSMWQYSKALRDLSINGIRRAETTIDKQTKVWLMIGLMIAAILLGSILASAGSLANAVQQKSF